MNYSEYDEYFKEKGIINYERDGAMNEKLWESAPIKILYVLKETAGYDKCPAFNLKDEIPLWLKKAVPTYTKIAKLSLVLLKSFERKSSLTKEECKSLGKNPTALFEALEHCAVINIKKTSGKSKSWDTVIRDNFNKNADFLQKQIDNLKPNIVIAGSSVCWECLSNNKNGLFKDVVNKKLNKHDCKKFGDIVFYHANHPSAWTSGGFKVVDIHKQIYDTWK